MLARIWSAALVQTKGLGFSLCTSLPFRLTEFATRSSSPAFNRHRRASDKALRSLGTNLGIGWRFVNRQDENDVLGTPVYVPSVAEAHSTPSSKDPTAGPRLQIGHNRQPFHELLRTFAVERADQRRHEYAVPDLNDRRGNLKDFTRLQSRFLFCPLTLGQSR